MDSVTIRSFNDEMKIATFQQLSVKDITGQGRIKPIAARHFAEQAEVVQNLSAFFASAIGADQDVRVHFSGQELAKLFERLLDLETYNIVQPYVRLAEQAEMARLQNSHQEQVQMEAGTSAGIFPGDHDM